MLNESRLLRREPAVVFLPTMSVLIAFPVAPVSSMGSSAVSFLSSFILRITCTGTKKMQRTQKSSIASDNGGYRCSLSLDPVQLEGCVEIMRTAVSYSSIVVLFWCPCVIRDRKNQSTCRLYKYRVREITYRRTRSSHEYGWCITVNS